VLSRLRRDKELLRALNELESKPSDGRFEGKGHKRPNKKEAFKKGTDSPTDTGIVRPDLVKKGR
jgi:hypothetical protein